ncbi:MAG TPA: hypothetical protein VHQ24_09805 [Lachnospiraceae bacterium]|nr:hypothetical protein [Lachnospiraceae bacterium]HEX3077144.1 hypothetical protein [Lachnospiraceae bacterium]
MDPISQSTGMNPANAMFFASVFGTLHEEKDYLSTLDSDTRDYVLKHTDEFSSREDLEDCVRRLHGEFR